MKLSATIVSVALALNPSIGGMARAADSPYTVADFSRFTKNYSGESTQPKYIPASFQPAASNAMFQQYAPAAAPATAAPAAFSAFLAKQESTFSFKPAANSAHFAPSVGNAAALYTPATLPAIKPFTASAFLTNIPVTPSGAPTLFNAGTTWATSASFKNTFDFDRNNIVNAADAARVPDLNSDTKIDNTDTELFNNILQFTKLTGAEQINTLQQIAPKYAATVLTDLALTPYQLNRAGTIINTMDTVASTAIIKEMETGPAAMILGNDRVTVETSIKIFNELGKPDATGQRETTAARILHSWLDAKKPERDRMIGKAASIINSMEPATAAFNLASLVDGKCMVNIPAFILGHDNVTNDQAIKILNAMANSATGAAGAGKILILLLEQTTTTIKATAVYKGLDASAQAAIGTEIGIDKTSTLLNGITPVANKPQQINVPDWVSRSLSTNCIAAAETFQNGNITVFWTNEDAIPAEELSLYYPGWQLRMIISADFNNDNKPETQDWEMNAAMVGPAGRSISLDMPPELNGKTVSVQFYVTDAQGNPLMKNAQGEWAIGKAAADQAYVFGAAAPNKPETAVSFKVIRDPAAGEQLPPVSGHNLSGNNLTIDFASQLDPWYFPVVYLVVNGDYTQISDYRYMMSDDFRSLTVDLDAFGINIPDGAKVQLVAYEWAHGMTLLQTIIQDKT